MKKLAWVLITLILALACGTNPPPVDEKIELTLTPEVWATCQQKVKQIAFQGRTDRAMKRFIAGNSIFIINFREVGSTWVLTFCYTEEARR